MQIKIGGKYRYRPGDYEVQVIAERAGAYSVEGSTGKGKRFRFQAFDRDLEQIPGRGNHMDTRGYKPGDKLKLIGNYLHRSKICTILDFTQRYVMVFFPEDPYEEYFYNFDEATFDFSWKDPDKQPEQSKILGSSTKEKRTIRLIRK